VPNAGHVAAIIVDGCIAAFGRIDVLHNNVGIVEVGGAVETSEERRSLAGQRLPGGDQGGRDFIHPSHRSPMHPVG
jgi:NAD(P)-dependent dehydrogenase (short-subunit alcohol dehydrogenase family)